VRIAHTCFECGSDLTRLPAPLDPQYRLPIVVCPGCRTAAVRRVHPTMVWARWLRRAAFAAFMLASRGVSTLLVAAVIVALTNSAWSMLRELSLGVERLDQVVAVTLLLWLLASLLGGLWMGLLFCHWNFVQIAAWWLAILLALPAIPSAMEFMDRLVTTTPTDAAALRALCVRLVLDIPAGYGLLVVSWGCALATIPAGRWTGIGWLNRRRRAAWLRARARRKSTWATTLLRRA